MSRKRLSHALSFPVTLTFVL